MRVRSVFLISGLICLILAAGATSASAATRQLMASMDGAQEAPGPGDADGRGAALITLRPANDQVCVSVRWTAITTANAMHIHEAPAGVAGPIVINLASILTGGRCVAVTDALSDAIRANPAGFYINIHNAPFPGGAIRGQLDPSDVHSALPPHRGPSHLFTRLTGAAEVPGPGDSDGRGAAFVDPRPFTDEVCVAVRHRALSSADAMHIHEAPAGVAGPIVVNLTPTLTGPRCVSAPDALIRDIIADPDAFYLNIHNADFPGGAIRGQLDPST